MWARIARGATDLRPIGALGTFESSIDINGTSLCLIVASASLMIPPRAWGVRAFRHGRVRKCRRGLLGHSLQIAYLAHRERSIDGETIVTVARRSIVVGTNPPGRILT